ncbi:RNA polymerase sigma factor [Inmirania thermothiophila]|uniref:RNA polymerase sigma-70 factor (ECF subfamily) n=1 Tax=Inmirania thermothiophila TaxID=1750597 RepID=A0A3N1YA93_9GAMM|nr:RNA polymerase sigma factor [Inmirania thermothiophila]ROR34317.1 RNA polymerase sigma-70 factor (ECF subfamily) [Inmirania thermothiophila]
MAGDGAAAGARPSPAPPPCYHEVLPDAGGEPLERQATLERFFAEVGARALRHAELATGDRDEALDLVQEAMIRLASRYRHRPAQEWGALFYRILENGIRDWQRRQAARRRWLGWLRLADGAGGDAAPDPAPDPASELAAEDARRALERALRTLPWRQQQAFRLRVWAGLDVASTARAMGCSEGSVKTHLSRALAALRPLLEAYRP